MTEKLPAGRPALRKSVDATVHPALAGHPCHRGGPGGEAREAPTRKQTTPSGPLHKARHPATSDVLRPTKQDPAVKLEITIPKSLRKRLRTAAKAAGIDAETLAARLIAERLQQG